jgi:dihydroflavonol-4-reductase
MKTIFLTGANGHIGSNIARELLRRGYRVVGYVRETSDLRGLHGLDIELRKGDILDRDRVTWALDGCDAVIHTAANFSLWAKKDAEILVPCVQGTDVILHAAKEHAIRRVVYTSSAVAVGGTRDQKVVHDENNWNADTSTAYYAAKTDSERLAHRLAEQLGLELITFNPTVVFGPLDFRPTPSTGIMVQALNGAGFVWDAIMAYVHVEDVARLHVDGLTGGEPGERYIVNSVCIHMSEFGKIVRELFAVRMLPLNFPRPITAGVGYLLGLLSRVTGKPPLYDQRIYDDYMAHNGNYDNGKSRRTFGIEYLPLETILTDSAAWLAHAGMLRPKVAARLRAAFPARPEWSDALEKTAA